MAEGQGYRWAYVLGEVAFAESYTAAAEKAAKQAGLSDVEAESVKHHVMVHNLPYDVDVAVGIIRNARPQIWQSNTDRAWVYQTVREIYGEMNAARNHRPDVQQQDHPPAQSR